MNLPADLDAALYAELLPHRITPPPSLHTGPTAQWAALEAQRELWALAADEPGLWEIGDVA